MVISFIPGLYGYVFESAIIVLNSYFYCWSEKLKKENWQEDEEFVKVYHILLFKAPFTLGLKAHDH